MTKPKIIQGGMGVGVSNWRLANAVSRAGQLGVVSGTFLDTVCARRLQLGDPEGHIRRVLERFPIPEIANRIVDRYFIEGGKEKDSPFKPVPMHTMHFNRELLELTVVANFVEVALAKEGHENPVGINYLEKIALPTLASMYGAMLAGVDTVIMGAGIPKSIPGILDQLANHQASQLKIPIENAQPEDDCEIKFDPHEIVGSLTQPLKRPQFFPIVSSNTLALTLAKKSTGTINGFIIEGATAGGHNAPPRSKANLSEIGEPIYGEKDWVDLDKIKQLGLPFWLAGSYGTPEKLQEALNLGASGVQIGTVFAFCEESGITPDIKAQALEAIRRGEETVFTDPNASPTGFPFKIFQLKNTVADETTYQERPRICDLGYLRTLNKNEQNKTQYLCPAEPISEYVRKGGHQLQLDRVKCLCNGLLATVGLGQIRNNGYTEPPIVTSGTDFSLIRQILQQQPKYNAAEAIQWLLMENTAMLCNSV